MKTLGLLVALLLGTPAQSPAQWGPPPVDLPIPNVPQETLASGRAVVLQVASGQASFHAIVLRGMEWVQGPYGLEATLYINDPLDYYTRPLPFWRLVDIWEAAIVVN